jgi:hypothetical protein
LFSYPTASRADFVEDAGIQPAAGQRSVKILTRVTAPHVASTRAIFVQSLFTLRRKSAVEELVRPFERMWDWVDRVGGYPGKALFLCAVLMVVAGAFTWYGNKR